MSKQRLKQGKKTKPHAFKWSGCEVPHTFSHGDVRKRFARMREIHFPINCPLGVVERQNIWLVSQLRFCSFYLQILRQGQIACRCPTRRLNRLGSGGFCRPDSTCSKLFVEQREMQHCHEAGRNNRSGRAETWRGEKLVCKSPLVRKGRGDVA